MLSDPGIAILAIRANHLTGELKVALVNDQRFGV